MVLKRFKAIIVFLGAGIVILVVVLAGFNFFLKMHQPVVSANFLIEGWCNAYDIEQTLEITKGKKKRKFFIVGKTYHVNSIEKSKPVTDREKGTWLLTNNLVSLRNEFLPDIRTGDTVNFILKARGTQANNLFPHVVIIINHKKIKSCFVKNDMAFYKGTAILDAPLESVAVFFDNDFSAEQQDRNLNLVSIQINDNKIFFNSSTADIFDEKSRRSGFNSDAQRAKNYLIDLGVNENEVEIIEFLPVERNITLQAAIAVLKHEHIKDINALNLISSEIHSRRTWYTYKKILPEDIDLGVIYFNKYFPGQKNFDERYASIKKLIDETFSYLGNWIYLNFVYKQ